MKYILQYLINKPLLIKLILIFILLLSIASALTIQRLGYPRVDMEKVNITTFYPGASPEDVELNVTVKLEEALKEIDGIEKYTSRSMENFSRIQVFVDSDAENKEKVKSDIRRAIETVSDLPVEVEQKPRIFEVKVDNFSIYEAALYSTAKDARSLESEKTLRRHAKELKKRILEISEVSHVYEQGIRNREFQVLLNNKKLAQKQIAFDDVIYAIKQNKLRLSGGSLESFTSKKGIITFSEFEKPKDIENIIIRASDLGYYVRIKDIGKVIDTFEKKDIILRYNGKHGVSLWISKKGKADVISTVDKIKSVIKDFKEEFSSDDIHVFSTFDDSIETKNRISIVYNNAQLGFFFVLLILFFFLHKNIAFWTAFGIPISIGMTLIMMPVFNITINAISLLGMVVVLGMVVDDAIIIGESIYRQIENGLSSKEAAIKGTLSVIRPVFATIITTIMAFIPIYFLPGIIGDFAVEIPTIVILMLAASLLEASFFLPVHLAITKKNWQDSKKPLGNNLLLSLERIYRKILKFILSRKKLSFIIFATFLISGMLFGVFLTKFNMFPIDQAFKVWLYGETQKDSSIFYTLNEVKKIENLIKELPQGVIHSYKSIIGRDFHARVLCDNCFYTFMILTPGTSRDMTATEVKQKILAKLQKNKDIKIEKIDFMIEGGGPPVGKPLEINITGNNNAERIKIVASIIEELKQLNVTEIDSNLRMGKEEIRIIPNYDALAQARLSAATVASTIRTAFDGTIVSYQQTPDEKIPLRVILDHDDINFDDPLKNLHVKNLLGNLVSIKNFVREEKTTTYKNIYHYNSERTNKITGNIDLEKTNPKEVYDKLNKKYKNFEKDFPGFKMILGGEAKESSETFNHIIISIIAAIISIYFLLVIVFNSFSQPVLVILAIPFGLIGIFFAFTIHGIDVSMLALMGILGFSGVVINDSLIMVDFINKLKKDKKAGKLEEAIIEGSVIRLRPIILTTLTTMAGLIPTAYGIIGGLDTFISPMVMAMTWGLLFGTTSVLLIIPYLYSINEDIIIVFSKFFMKVDGFFAKIMKR